MKHILEKWVAGISTGHFFSMFILQSGKWVLICLFCVIYLCLTYNVNYNNWFYKQMLIALSGVMTGYNGSFPFEKPGDKYNDVNYVGMRKVKSLWN